MSLGFIYFRKPDIRAIVVFCFVLIYDMLAIFYFESSL